jgi:hypothetical protein
LATPTVPREILGVDPPLLASGALALTAVTAAVVWVDPSGNLNPPVSD